MRCGLLLIGLLGVMPASAASLLLVPSQNAQPYLQVVDHLLKALAESSFSIHITPAEALERAQLDQYPLVLTLGTRALETVLSLNGATPTLAAMVPRDGFDALTRSAARQQAVAQGRLSALYLDQPYWRQLRLARQVAPNARRLGALLGPHSSTHRDELMVALAGYAWQARLATLDAQDNPLSVIRDLVAQSDLLLAVPDQADFNRNTARWLLMLSLREGIPLIGFSQRYVEAGALAAVFSSPQSIAAEAAGWILRWHLSPDQRLPQPSYPQQFEVRLNAEIGARLRLQLPSIQTLQQALQRDATP